jgi:VWFA-related protein
MRCGCVLLAVLADAGFAQNAQAPAAQQQPALTERPATTGAPENSVGRLQLDVVVTDRSGEAVAGLQLNDFTLLNDNHPEKILSFTAFEADKALNGGGAPASVILVMDDLNIGARNLPYAKQQVEKFLRQNGGHLSLPISILTLSPTKLLVLGSPSTDGNGLANLLEQQKSELRTGGVALGGNGSVERYVMSLNALDSIVNRQGKSSGRKLLVWIGGGWPILDGVAYNLSVAGAEKRNFAEIVSLSSRIREARIALYTTSWDLGNLNFDHYRGYLKGVRSARQADFPDLSLQVLSVQSGGRVLNDSTDLTAEINRCLADATAFYRISFDPPRADRVDEYHDIEVQIDKPGLTARSSTGYYAQP